MTWQDELKQVLRSKALISSAIAGAGFAFLMICIVLTVSLSRDINFNPWIFLPVFAVTLAGAFGGTVYLFTAPLRLQGGWKKWVTIVVFGLFYIVACYMSLILSLYAIGLWH